MAKKEEPIELRNTPEFYQAYMENWLTKAKAKKDVYSPTEIAIIEDICTLVKVASGVIVQIEKEN